MKDQLVKLFFGKQEIHNKGAIDLYRMVFGLSGLIFSINTLDQFYLLFECFSRMDVIYYQLVVLSWIAGSLILVFFAPSRLFLIFYYLVVYIVFSSHQGVLNVEGKYMILGSFLNVFLPLGRGSALDKKDYKLILILLVVMTAYLFLGGFITKSRDHTWASGVGLYYVMILPWIKYPFLDLLLHSPLTMKAMNYYVLFVELFAFIFSVFARTRALGIILSWCFCLFLFLLLQISTIGLTSFAFALLFLSIFPFRLGFLQNRLGPDLNSLLAKIPLSAPVLNLNGKINFQLNRLRFFMVLGLYSWFFILFFRGLDNAFFGDKLRRFWWRTEKLNSKTYCLFYDHLFTSMHFADVIEYRVKIKLKSGEMIEPVKVFNEDKTGGPYSGWPFNARWLQAEMYRFNDFIIYPILEKENKLPNQFKRMFRFLESKVDYRSIDSFHFYTARLKMPDHYDPLGCEFAASDPWTKVLIYNPVEKTAFLPVINKKIKLTQ
jgi:hypothetical protein